MNMNLKKKSGEKVKLVRMRNYKLCFYYYTIFSIILIENNV